MTNEYLFEGHNCEILPEDYVFSDYSFKIILIGNSGVGKTSLTMKATKNIFNLNYNATVGFEFSTFIVKVDNYIIKLQIWDTCGQEIYRSLISNFYRNSSLAVIVYSIIDTSSFDSIDQWLKELKSNSSPDIKIFLIGNKLDLEDQRVITTEQGKMIQTDYNLDLFVESSARDGKNTEYIFVEAAKLLYNDYVKYKIGNPLIGKTKSTNNKLKKNENNKKDKKKCC
jgi:small GTP-binding protein